MTAQEKPVGKKGIKDSWEYRSVRFILRTMLVLIFLGYLLFTVSGTISWGMMKWVRSQPLENLTVHAEKSIKQERAEKIVDWINFRPASERAQIMTMLKPYSSELGSQTFMVFSKWEGEQGHPDESLFWYQLARYRLRFDALRCGFSSATDDMNGLLSLAPQKTVEDAIKKDPNVMAKSIRQVLDFDAEYPARNNPAYICGQLTTLNKLKLNMIPRERWADIRHTLRLVTEVSLKGMKPH